MASLSSFAYHNPKRMPSLDVLVDARPRPVVQTPEQMRAVFDSIRKAMTG